MKTFPLLLLVPAFLMGCDVNTSPAQLESQEEQVQLTASNPVGQIQVLESGTVNGGNFTVLGEVKGSVGKATILGKTPSVADAEAKLRIEAAKLGANAVINAEISEVTVCPLSWGCRNASGTAVVFQ